MSAPSSISRLRWWLCGLLFVATALSFLDRQVLSALAPTITGQLGISNKEYAYVTTAFLISYAIMFLGGGRLMDVVGTRLGMALSVGLWSVASGLHAVAQNAFQLGFFRFVLGVGEGGCFPGAAKGVTEWFPADKRALAIGIANGGSAFGAVLAPPLAVWLANIVTWRGAFVATGLMGAAWVVAWWWLSRGISPDRAGVAAPVSGAKNVARRLDGEGTDRAAGTAAPTPGTSVAARVPRAMPATPATAPNDGTTHRGDVAAAGTAASTPGTGVVARVPRAMPATPATAPNDGTTRRGDAAAAGTAASTPAVLQEERPAFLALLGRSDVWGLALMRFIFDPVFYFYMFWIPKYLSAERGASQQQIGELTWIPFLALGISNALGGWVSDGLVRRGLSAMAARKTVMAAAALMTMASGLTGLVKTVEMALAMMSLLMFAHGFWITNYIALITDRFPKTAVGTVVGFAGTVGAVGGILANTSTGWIVDRFSYGPLWLASGFIYPLAFAVLMLTIRGRSAFQKGQKD